MIEKYASVWDSLSNSPGEAEVMKVRSTLMVALRNHAEAEQWSVDEAAKRFGVAASRVSQMMTGKIDRFTIDELLLMAGNVRIGTTFALPGAPAAP